MNLRPPNFFIPGAQKAGTTYLCAQLAKHPDIYISSPKEPMYFNSTQYSPTGVSKYLQTFFSAVNQHSWVGEGSTLYFQDKEAPGRIQHVFGSDLKFMICLRHPIEKALSLYLHNYRRGRMTGYENLLDLNEGSLAVLPRSVYAPWIERFIEIFGLEQLKFLLYDQLVASPRDFVDAATSFLGIEPVKNISKSRINAGGPWAWRGDALEPAVKLDMQCRNRIIPRIRKVELDRMQEIVLPDVAKTEALIDRNLHEWKSLPDFNY